MRSGTMDNLAPDAGAGDPQEQYPGCLPCVSCHSVTLPAAGENRAGKRARPRKAEVSCRRCGAPGPGPIDGRREALAAHTSARAHTLRHRHTRSDTDGWREAAALPERSQAAQFHRRAAALQRATERGRERARDQAEARSARRHGIAERQEYREGEAEAGFHGWLGRPWARELRAGRDATVDGDCRAASEDLQP